MFDRVFEGDGDVPRGVIAAHFGEVAHVADVIADAVFVDVGVDLLFAGEFFGEGESFQDRAGVVASAADVVDLGHARGFEEFLDEAGDIVAVDVVADLFAFVAVDFVFLALEIAFHEVTEEAVQLDAGVVRSGEAAAAQAAGGHVEVASVFLHDDVGRGLGCAEERVFRLVDGEILGDAVGVGGIVIIPTGFEFLEFDVIRTVAVNLVGRHVDEGRPGAGATDGFEQVQGADGIGVEVIERDGGGAVVAGLRGGVDDGVGLELGDEIEDALAVADVEFVVVEVFDQLGQALLVPAGVTLRSEENGALVVVEAVDFPTEVGEVETNLRADEAGGSSDEKFFHREQGAWSLEPGAWSLEKRVRS